jgi:FkbM family methyltransferase
MLIPFAEVYSFIKNQGRNIKGILHVGAHECEERIDYNREGINDSVIYWVEGNKDKVEEMKQKNVPNIFHALVDIEERDVEFNITNNGQSSSILPLDTHSKHYPHIIVSEKRKMRTTTLKNIIEENSFPIQNLDFWNFDIQGAELLALKGAAEYLKYANYIYIEVNVETLYSGCALLPELDDFLALNGFQRVGIKLVEQGWGDALYLRVA